MILELRFTRLLRGGEPHIGNLLGAVEYQVEYLVCGQSVHIESRRLLWDVDLHAHLLGLQLARQPQLEAAALENRLRASFARQGWASGACEQLVARVRSVHRDLTAGDISAADAREFVTRRMDEFMTAPSSYWHDHQRDAIDEALRRDPCRVVHFTMRSQALELFRLPWELLPLAHGSSLGRNPRILIRYAQLGQSTATEPVGSTESYPPGEGGRILLAHTLRENDVVEAHRRAIEVACQWHPSQSQRPYEVLDNPSWEQLQNTLERERDQSEPFAILHILCHGVWLDDAVGVRWSREPNAIAVREFGDRLRNHAHQVRLVILSVCDGGNEGLPGNDLGSMARRLHREGFQSVIAWRAPLTYRGSADFTQVFYERLLGEPDSLERAFLAARQSMGDRAPGALEWTDVQLFARPEDGDDTRPIAICPYRGLEPFTACWRRFYVGREEQIDTYRAHLGERRALLLTGESGLGKSSIALAGLLPAPNRDEWVSPQWLIMRPGDMPCAALATALAEHSDMGVDVIEASLLASGDALSRLVLELPRRGPEFTLVVEQFEELFSECAGTISETGQGRAFVDNLAGAVRNARACGIRVILTMRADYEDAFQSLPVLGELFDLMVRRVPAMTREQLERAIREPAARVGLHVDASVINPMLEQVLSQAQLLPLMQHALRELWHRRQGRCIGYDAYDQIGGLEGAVARTAERALESYSPDQIRPLFRRLVHPGDGAAHSKRQVPLDELASVARTRELIDRLAAPEVRLISENRGKVELNHEVLIRKWKLVVDALSDGEALRMLHEVRRAADGWHASGKRMSDLWSFDTQLQQSQKLHKERRLRDEELNELERSFLRQSRLKKIAIVVFGSTLLLALTALIVIVVVEKARFERVARLKRDVARVTAATDRYEDPATAIALLADVEDKAQTPEWLSAATQSLQHNSSHAVLRGHERGVTHAEFNPDGGRVVTASLDGTVRLWQADGAGPAVVIGRHDGPVYYVTFSPDGSRIASASGDGTARIWSVDGTGTPFILDHEQAVHHIEFSPDGSRVVTASLDKKACVWSADRGEQLHCEEHRHFVVHAEFDASGERVVTASFDGTARVWSVDGSGMPIPLPHGEKVYVNVARFSPSDGGQRVVTASSDGVVRVWPVDRSGEPIELPARHRRIVYFVAFSPDGSRVASASWDGTAIVQNTDGSGKATVFRDHASYLYSISFSPDGERVATAGGDGTARVWNANGSGQAMELRGHSQIVYYARFSPDGNTVVTSSMDRTARVWDIRTNQEPIVLTGHEMPVYRAHIAPNGPRRVATASFDGTARIWSASGDLLVSIDKHNHGAAVLSARFDPSGKYIVTASEDGTTRVWDAATGAAKGKPFHHEAWVSYAEFSPNGERIATSSWDDTARIWRTPEDWLTLGGHTDSVLLVSFDSEGGRVVTASSDGTARIWNANNGEEIATLPHPDVVYTARFSDDGNYIVTASGDGIVRVWTTGDARLYRTFEGHVGGVNAAAFSPGGSRILSAGQDRTVRIWTLDGTRPPVVFRGLARISVYWAEFSTDGNRFVIASDDATASLWRMEYGARDAIEERLQERQGSNCLTYEQRIRLIGQDSDIAWQNYQACEAAHGREPSPRGAHSDPARLLRYFLGRSCWAPTSAGAPWCPADESDYNLPIGFHGLYFHN